MKTIFFLLTLLQREILRRRILLVRLLKFSEWALILGWLVISLLYGFGQIQNLFLLLAIGKKLGSLAFLFYVATLVPGLIRRLKIPQILPIMSMLLPFRRQFGVLMFLTAFVHQSFVLTLPYLVLINFDLSQFPPPLATQQIAGFSAWFLLLPLWLTSNDKSVKYLGKWWQRVHKLTYVALFLIMLHVALVSGWNYVLVLAAILLGNVWGLVYKTKRNKGDNTLAEN